MAKSPELKRVVINDRGAARLRGGHVWGYASDVLNDGGAAPGALVHVLNTRGKLQGTAVFSSASQIKLRLVSRDAIQTESEFGDLIGKRLASAVEYRRRLVRDTDAYRLVFSEADLLPGLIIDRYQDICAVQILAQAWDSELRRNLIIQSLKDSNGINNVVERVDPRIRELENLPPRESALISGDRSATVFQMNGVQFHYDALSGQKTGAFLDQRENYAAAAHYARGEALDICAYQGGFALHLARRCVRVTGVDISREALEVAEQNEKLNAGAHKNEIDWIEGNAFDLMRDYADAGKQYDTIVLDPPAFAKSKKNLAAALRGYKELNLRALKMLRPGGVLVTCSCSFAVGEQDFLAMLTDAAQDAHRSVTVLETRAQAKDHPVLLGVPETHYLKCVICTVPA
ncbi:MAG TPA: class I SAM-dependent rRNA methyltransferase [Candidatus Angelobacter sp.]|jgi:23S rRNA (cytosine1962-C5)-methyltransferase|nr:class I SAM-dependent rRNA methyltransferase [Candidatus Angelobacter sp.]